MFPKKCFALLLALVLILPSLAFSEELPAYQPGDTVDLVFTVTDNPNLAVGVTLRLDYDHSAFELLPSSYVQNDAPIISLNIQGIPVGETVPVSFLVLPDAPSGVYDIQILVEQAADIDEKEVDGFAFSAFQVRVTSTQDALAAENEALRRQLEEALAALEEERARAAAQADNNPAVPDAAPETDFAYIIQDSMATITKYIGPGGDVVVPDTLGGCPVRVIGGLAFYGCSRLTGVTIPGSVASIGNNAFAKCSSLAAVTIQDGAVSLGNHAFAWCGSLTGISIPGSAASIGDHAFFRCTSLAGITIPGSVASIGSYAFTDCSDDLVISVEKGSYAEQYCRENALYYLIESDGRTGFLPDPSPETDFSYAIQDGMATVTKYTGPGGDVVVPDTLGGCPVNVIGGLAFYGCSGLTGVTIPESVTSIGQYAFNGCSGLTSISIFGSVTELRSGTFNGCSSLTSIFLPDGLATIGSGAFNGCSSLTSVSIPSSVTSILSYAFSRCSSLYNFSLPDSVTSIGTDAFSGCDPSLTITVSNNSYAEQYCKENGLNYIIR